jgi:hypothetical protein
MHRSVLAVPSVGETHHCHHYCSHQDCQSYINSFHIFYFYIFLIRGFRPQRYDMLSNPPNFWDILHLFVMNGLITHALPSATHGCTRPSESKLSWRSLAHALTFSLSGTSALIFALRGVEGVAQGDV